MPRASAYRYRARACGASAFHAGSARLRRGDRGVDVVLRAVRHARDDLVRRGIDDVERLTRLGPRAVDVVAEHALVLPEPGESFLVALRRGAVLHCLEDFGDGMVMSNVECRMASRGASNLAWHSPGV